MNISGKLFKYLLIPLRRSPGLRSAIYLGTAAGLLQTVSGWYRQSYQDYPTRVILTHLTVLPLGAAVTLAGLALEERSPRELLPTLQDGSQIALGFGAGTIAWLAFLGIAQAKGWISSPSWGWNYAPLDIVLRFAALNMVGHLAIAWNEEQVFRGYGFDTLQASIGTTGATLVLVPLFAAGHPLHPLVIVGQSMLGLLCTAQRLSTNSIWFGVGYHWAWNAMQSAIFGQTNAPPSIRPLQVHGPEIWVGRPGHPEPGLLSSLIHFLGLVVVGLIWWWRHTKQKR
jgi:membrane protease YdiL (CAAX protease family)